MTPYRIDAVQGALQRLDLKTCTPLADEVLAFSRYYGIDMENQLPGIQHYCGWFDAGAYRLAAHAYLPPRAQGTVFLVHGYFDHAGLFQHLIRDCLSRGFAVFIADLPGHGLSTGARADIASFDEYHDALQAVLQFGQADLPAPFYAIGQSLGAGIVMDYLLRACAQGQSPLFRKALLLAPLLRPRQWPEIRFFYPVLRRLRSSTPRIFHPTYTSEAFMRFLRERDPLQGTRIPMGWVGALRDWVGHMHRLPPCDVPVLLVQGKRDATVAWRQNIDFINSHFCVEHAAFPEQASHHLANEREDLRQPVHDALARMLSAS